MMAAPEISPKDPVPPVVVVTPAPAGGIPPGDAATTVCRIPHDTPVELEIADTMASNTAVPGQTFHIRLAASVTVGGARLLAAGMTGVGEVIHAARAGGAGKPGELILTARYLEQGGAHLKLRGFKLGGAGKSEGGQAFVASMFGGPLAFAVKGGEIVFASGTRANARLAEDVELPGACPALITSN